MILLNSRDVSERLGSLYAFKSYLHENEEGQIALASTLRSTSTCPLISLWRLSHVLCKKYSFIYITP